MVDFYAAEDMVSDFMAAERLPVIFAPEGQVLNDEEIDFFTKVKPFGFILFARNCDSPDQIKALVANLRACAGWACPILIDQEGGRVMRLKEPNWPKLPASMPLGKIADADAHKGAAAVYLQAETLAKQLLDLGIDVDCMPVADVYEDGVTDNCIGDRAYSSNAALVGDLCASFIERALEVGLTPIIKHMPGHGQARVDSHKELPVVTNSLETLHARDFLPFEKVTQKLGGQGLWGMVAHIIFSEIDHKYPSSLSHKIIDELIRKKWGYEQSLLVSDDINMGALNPFGDVGVRSRMSLNAGLDIVLHCSGILSEMKDVAGYVPPMSLQTLERVKMWLALRAKSYKKMPQGSLDEMAAQLNALLPVA